MEDSDEVLEPMKCPKCGALVITLWSGVKCSKCTWWFCY
jgi:hypothetical protein